MAVSSTRCRLDGMACGSVKTVSKNGKYRVPSMMANIFFSLVWGFCVFRRMQCGSFFSNWNISTIVLLILKYIRIVASVTLFGLVDFGFLWSAVFYEGSSVVLWGGYTSGWGFFYVRHASENLCRREMHDFANFVFGFCDFLETRHDWARSFLHFCLYQFFVYLNSGMWVGTGSGVVSTIDKRLFIKGSSIVERFDNR